jgi:hypothetical protein
VIKIGPAVDGNAHGHTAGLRAEPLVDAGLVVAGTEEVYFFDRRFIIRDATDHEQQHDYDQRPHKFTQNPRRGSDSDHRSQLWSRVQRASGSSTSHRTWQ